MNDDAAPDLAGLCSEVAAELDEITSAADDGMTSYARGSAVFARVTGSRLEVRLPTDIAEAALRTPDTGPRIRCGVGRNMQAITRDGKIYPCHRYAGEDAFQLGTIEEGIDRNRLRDYYKSIVDVKEDHCSHCWARHRCARSTHRRQTTADRRRKVYGRSRS